MTIRRGPDRSALVDAVEPDQTPNRPGPRESSSKEALMIAKLPGTSRAATNPFQATRKDKLVDVLSKFRKRGGIS